MQRDQTIDQKQEERSSLQQSTFIPLDRTRRKYIPHTLVTIINT